MQRIIRNVLAILLFLTAPAYAGGGMTMMMAAGSSAAAGCPASPVETSFAAGSSGLAEQNDVAGNRYFASQIWWTVAANKTVCKVEWKLTKNGTITGFTYTTEIWTTNASKSLVAKLATSDGITGSASWSATTVAFNFTGANLVSLTGEATQYAIVLATNAEGSTTNYVTAVYVTPTVINGFLATNKADKTINDVFETYDYQLNIYYY